MRMAVYTQSPVLYKKEGRYLPSAKTTKYKQPSYARERKRLSDVRKVFCHTLQMVEPSKVLVI